MLDNKLTTNVVLTERNIQPLIKKETNNLVLIDNNTNTIIHNTVDVIKLDIELYSRFEEVVDEFKGWIEASLNAWEYLQEVFHREGNSYYKKYVLNEINFLDNHLKDSLNDYKTILGDEKINIFIEKIEQRKELFLRKFSNQNNEVL